MPLREIFMYNVKLNTYLEAITDNDAAYLFVSALNHSRKLNKNIYNAGGGDAVKDYYRNILANVLDIYGLNIKYILNSLFIDKNFYVHTYLDSDKLNDILEYRSDSLSSYYMRLKRSVKSKRLIRRILAKPLVLILKRKKTRLKK